MGQTEALINALSEWDEETGENKINDFETLILFILHRLGDNSYFDNRDGNPLDKLENRIDYLTEECEMHEDLLVMGVVNFITEMIENKVRKHGEFIINQGKMREQDVSDEMNELTQRKLAELKSNEYKIKAVRELDEWKLIKTRYFSESKRDSWENERLMEAHDSVREMRTNFLESE